MDDNRMCISIKSAALRLGISHFHLYGMTERNEFPHVHIGRRVVVEIRDIENYIRKNKEASLEK